MPGYDTSTDLQDPDITGNTDRSLITDISASLSYLSSASRMNRQKEKLRQELVSEYLENRKKSPSLLRSIANTLTKPL